MDVVNEKYWYEQWHLDYELHARLGVKNVTPILKKNGEEVSIYADTDSLFVSFEPAINNCEWRNLYLNNIDSIDKKFSILEYRQETKTDNQNCLGIFRKPDELKEFLKNNTVDYLIIDGYFVKDRGFNSPELKELLKDIEIRWNWFNELDFIHGIDGFRFGGYFKNCCAKIPDILVRSDTSRKIYVECRFRTSKILHRQFKRKHFAWYSAKNSPW